jgi:hypothetical protein
MKHRNHILLAAGFSLALSMLACNLPGPSAPTPFVFSTSAQTITAVISPTASLTPQAIPTIAPVPSATTPAQPVEIPSSTPVPATPTATQIPPTPVPTQTTVPTVSYAGPGQRKGVSIPAGYMAVKPVINADFSDWNFQKHPVSYVVFGSKNWKGSGDLSGKLMVGWDNDKLYIAIKVLDDTYVQNARGAQLYKGDSIDILLDTNVASDYYLKALSSDDFQLGISPGSPQPGNKMEAYLWYPKNRAGSLPDVKIEAFLLDDGYRLEAAIPWSTFGIIPFAGQHFGFAFSLSDDDDPGTTIQQSMVSTIPNRQLTNPTTWGDLTLVK